MAEFRDAVGEALLEGELREEWDAALTWRSQLLESSRSELVSLTETSSVEVEAVFEALQHYEHGLPSELSSAYHALAERYYLMVEAGREEIVAVLQSASVAEMDAVLAATARYGEALELEREQLSAARLAVLHATFEVVARGSPPARLTSHPHGPASYMDTAPSRLHVPDIPEAPHYSAFSQDRTHSRLHVPDIAHASERAHKTASSQPQLPRLISARGRSLRPTPSSNRSLSYMYERPRALGARDARVPFASAMAAASPRGTGASLVSFLGSPRPSPRTTNAPPPSVSRNTGNTGGLELRWTHSGR
jgi:hypothetical protein